MFDWGDTLMVDYPNEKGKMRYWDDVSEISGAAKVLKHLAMNCNICIATGAADSSEADIEAALARVNLSQYITAYFCQSNLGIGKESSGFYTLILSRLNTPASSITMVGDSYKRDIEPALSCGMQAIWLNPHELPVPSGIKSIQSLSQLINK